MIRAALIQVEIRGSQQERLAHVLELIDQIAGADLILLPELWSVGYFKFERYGPEAEPLEGPILSALAAKARQLEAYILVGSIVERDGNRLYNTSPLVGPRGEIVAAYRKIHLFSYRSKEKELLTPGDRIVVARSELGTWGLSTCYDLRFPELYRAQVDQGVQLFLVVGAWPQERIGHWQILAQVRALENQAFLLGCNAAGFQYGGRSLAISPQGEIVAQAGQSEQVLRVGLDLGEVERVRAEFPALRDRVLR
jgi:predicted amidohydrolase